jgi:UPF0716 family protein affecting phage T7 exclusion
VATLGPSSSPSPSAQARLRSGRSLLFAGLLIFVAAIFLDLVLPFPWYFIPTFVGFGLLLAGLVQQNRARTELRAQRRAAVASGASAAPVVVLTPEQRRRMWVLILLATVVPVVVLGGVLWRLGWFGSDLAIQAVLLLILTANVGINGVRVYYVVKIRREYQAKLAAGVPASAGTPSSSPLSSIAPSGSFGATGSGLVLGMRTCPHCSSMFDPSLARCSWCGQPA